jgi:uncharacterized protein HemX
MKDSKQLNDKIEDVAIDPVDRLLKEKKPASSGKGIAILALLVALATVSESAWQWWQARSAGTDVAAQQETMSRIQQNQQQFARSMGTVEARLKSMDEPGNDGEISSLGQQFASLESKITGMQSQSDVDKASMAALQGGLRSNDLRLSTVEAGLSSVAANSQNSGAELDLAEIDFLLRVANERLQLFADPSAADLALQAADVQIDALEDPMFLSVRQRIATSREALATVPRIDRVELSARISSMQAGIRSLPFRGETSSAPTAELPAETGWWASLKQTLSSLVTVRRRVPEEETLLSLEDKDYLRQGLWLQLESARLALMRKDADTYLGSLLRVKQTIEQYFANGSSPVQALLLEITTLERVEVAPVMPDVSAAWTQLRQLRDSRRLLQSVPPAVTKPVEAGDSGE